jgi:hypothetical protein
MTMTMTMTMNDRHSGTEPEPSTPTGPIFATARDYEPVSFTSYPQNSPA